VDPPPGTDFVFDFETFFPIAKATMEVDPRLEEKRFQLVPKQSFSFHFHFHFSEKKKREEERKEGRKEGIEERGESACISAHHH